MSSRVTKLHADLVALARRQLCEARAAKQEAQIYRDYVSLHREANYVSIQKAAIYENVAKVARFNARHALGAAELLAGKYYLVTGQSLRLKDILDGKNFSKWGEYEEVFSDKNRYPRGDTWL